MKKVLFFLVAVIFTFSFMSCESLARGALSGAIGSVLGGSNSGSSLGSGNSVGSGNSSGSSETSARAPLAADFQPGDMLVSEAAGSMIGEAFYVARVLTPASTQSKNQAEIIYVGNGAKAWVNYVTPSRKANKDDFKVGMEVFCLAGWAGYDDISVDSYRKDQWRLGRVTSTEELYKNRVEVDGSPFAISYLRIPSVAVK